MESRAKSKGVASCRSGVDTWHLGLLGWVEQISGGGQMSDVLRLVGGSEVHCADGHCGSLARLLIEPGTKAVSHIAVEVPGLSGDSRLVPIARVQEAGDSVLLSCSKAEFDAFEPGEESHLAPVLAIRGGGLPFARITLDRVPDGDVEVSGEDRIEATDGHIGRLRGMDISSADHRITRLHLEIGHFAAKKTVEVPVASVAEITDDAIKLSMSKSQVSDLV